MRGDVVARRRRRLGRVISGLRGGVVWAQGQSAEQVTGTLRVTEAGALPLAQGGCGGIRVAQARRPGGWGRGTRGRRRVVAGVAVANQVLREAAEGGLPGPTRQAGAATQARRVLAVP